MTDQRLHLLVGVQVSAIMLSTSINLLAVVWWAKRIHRRLDALESRLDRVQ